jgi:dTDP-glucose pyrophosphorylase/predicted transcriptional regulator
MMDSMNCSIQSDASIRSALEVIDRFAKGVALVLDGENQLLGILTDGDIRRALLQNASLDDSVSPWISKDYVSVGHDVGRAEVLDLMQARLIDQVPVVDEAGRVVGLHLLHDIIGGRNLNNAAVIMAGGKGMRLRPITEHLPKPMIKVAGRPILERLVLHLVSYGITRIYLAVNYMGHVIEDHFGDGSRFGCSIEYLREEEPLGTGGSLSLLPEVFDEPVLVMNGDLVMQANLEGLLRFHDEGQFHATMGVKPYRHEVPFGCVESDSGRMLSIKEKPSIDRLINAGVYVLSPEALKSIPKSFFPITELFESALASALPCGSFLIEDEWTDVGRIGDLNQAQGKSL